MASMKISWRLKAGLIIVLLLALVKFGLVPFYEWHDMTMQKIKVLQKNVGRKKALIGKEKEVNDLFIKAETSFKQAASFYVRGFSAAQSLQLALQKQVEALSSTFNIAIKSTDWLSPSEGEIVQAPIEVDCEAPPNQLVKFIAAIETGKLFISIDRLIINAGRNPGKSLVKATLDISAYGIREDKKKKGTAAESRMRKGQAEEGV